METKSYSKVPKTKVRIRTEWGDYGDCELAFGLSRSFIYQRMKEGQIRSVLVRGRGRSRGKRIFSFASIRQLIAAEEEAAVTK